MPKLTIDTEALKDALAIAGAFVPNRSPKPVLQNVLIDHDGKDCFLIASDLENTCRAKVAGVEGEPCKALLSSGKLRGLLTTATSDTITLTATDKGNTLKTVNASLKLNSEPPDEFPAFKFNTDAGGVTVEAHLLLSAIRKVSYAIDDENSRYALGGMLLELDGNTLNLVTTDGRRLAYHPLEVTVNGGWHDSTIVPELGIKRFIAVLAGIAGDCHLTATANEITIHGGNIAASARLLEGRFPRWRDILPKGDANVSIMAGTLLNAVQHASLAATDESKGIDFDLTNGSLSLTAKSAEVGTSSIEIPAASQSSASSTLDMHFVRELLAVHDRGAMVDVMLGEGPNRFVCGDTTAIIMPMAKE